MPKRPRKFLANLENLGKAARALIEKLSPHKKRKTRGKENDSIDHSSIASLTPVGDNASNTSNVFLAAPTFDTTSPSHVASQTGFFYHTGPPIPATGNNDSSFHDFSLPHLRRRHRATVHEVPDEDDKSFISTSSMYSFVSDSSLSTVPDDNAEPALQDEMNTPGTSPQIHDESPLPDGKLREAPSILDALAALKDLKELLRPHRRTGRGYIDPGLDRFVRVQMESMEIMLNFYTGNLSKTRGLWAASSLQAAVARGKGRYWSRLVRILVRQFILDRQILLVNPYGYWNNSMLVDEDLKSDINLYLQELGKDITAEKLVLFLAREDIVTKHGITSKISLRTAQRYLKTLGYRGVFLASFEFVPNLIYDSGG
ncbi:hypothetical protein C8R45DRAFT_1115184 [Mycena sanguinolenta]|nr:hypothetical protein C8R45DRAFT_1115184 [Mycena sanguinolenta]